MIDEEKSTQLNPIYVWAIAAEYFTIMQTCQLLRVSVNRIRAYIERDDDPMPFRCFPGQTKGYFIHKDDLREWLMRNTVMVHDEKANHGSQRTTTRAYSASARTPEGPSGRAAGARRSSSASASARSTGT